MTKKSKLFILPLVIALAAAIGFAGCSQSTPVAPTTQSSPTQTTPAVPELSGTVTLSGSTTVQPVAEEIGQLFMSKNPKVKIVIQGGGSSVGVKAATAGTVDIGMASREITTDEKSKGVVEHVLAKDGIAIVSHPSQTVKDLTKQQVQDIFSGKIKNWSEVGGANKAITVVAREEGSGTRAAFEEMVLGKGIVIVSTAILQPSNGALRTTVAGDPNAIGFISLGYLDSSVKSFNIGGVACTVENAKKGTYPIVRPLLLLTKGQPTGLANDFLKFCMGADAQKLVAKDYIPIN